MWHLLKLMQMAGTALLNPAPAASPALHLPRQRRPHRSVAVRIRRTTKKARSFEQGLVVAQLDARTGRNRPPG